MYVRNNVHLINMEKFYLEDVRSAFKIKLKNINKKGMVTLSRVFIS
jgi:hypothetical protein